MISLFENSDTLATPIECFEYHASEEKFPVHAHWHYYMEIIYMLSGKAIMTNGDESIVMEPGKLQVFFPKVIHSITSEQPEELRYIVFKFDISKVDIVSDYAPKLRSICMSAEKKKMRTLFDEKETQRLSCDRIFRECVTEIMNKEYGYDAVVRADIHYLMIEILRMWQNEGFQIDKDIYTVDGRYDIDSITEYIDQHIGENLKVADLAKRCGMSYSYFAKKFTYIYGKSCKEYISDIRIYKVEEYLLFTDFDLNYISQETGFSDCSHLIKCFRSYRGVTPTQFRMRRKG